MPESFLRPNPGSNLRIQPDAEALTATGAVRHVAVHVDGRAIHTKYESLSWKSPGLFIYKSPLWVVISMGRCNTLTKTLEDGVHADELKESSRFYRGIEGGVEGPLEASRGAPYPLMQPPPVPPERF